MNLKVSDAKREDGFTLIELLVVVIIIGILAAIAIPVFLNQRERAWIRTAESDARNAAIEIETYFNDEFAYPDSQDFDGIPDGDVIALTDAADQTIAISPNVLLTYTKIDDTNYTIGACHDLVNTCDGSEFTAFYDSAGGGIDTSGDYPEE